MNRLNKYIIPLLVLFIGFVLLFRLYLSTVRFFDPDEFAHLHWTYLLSIGHLPYRDIFMYHIPFFQLLLLPFFFLPQSSSVLIMIRIFTFLIYISNLYVLYLIVKKMGKSNLFALISVAMLSVFPMTMDKSIDIRPDMLMILLFLVSVYLLVRKESLSQNTLILSGVSFGLSLLTFPKIIYGLPPLVFLIFSRFAHTLFLKRVTRERDPDSQDVRRPSRRSSTIGERARDGNLERLASLKLGRSGQDPKYDNAKQVRDLYFSLKRELIFFSLGILIPLLIFFLYLLLNGILNDAYISFTKYSVAVTAGKWKFTPWLALSPWPLVYVGAGGVSWPWIVNCAFWIMSGLGLIVLLFNFRRLFFITFLFLSGGILLLFLFPSPYLQYFMPLTVFGSVSAAAFLHFLYKKTVFFPLIFLFVIGIFVSFWQQAYPRTKSDSREQMTVISDLLRISRPRETFFDMVGSYVFRPDAYFLCCHPFIEFVRLLPFRLPPLSDEIRRNETKFLIMDRTGLLFWKTPEPDAAFVRNNYLASIYRKIYTLGWHFNCTDGTCRQYDVDNKPLPQTKVSEIDVPVSEKYAIRRDPVDAWIKIDGKNTGDKISLEKGKHSFSVSPSLRFFELQLDR